MLFSIIIPVYNYADYLEEAVCSVLSQPDDDYEIIIVDDGSTDRSAEVAGRLVASHPEVIRLVQQENRGPGAARNAGIRQAGGQYCLFLDADDRLTNNALQAFRGGLAAKPEVGMVIAGHVSIHPDGKRREHRPPDLKADRKANFEAYLRKKFGVSNGASIIARQSFDGFGFPEDIRNGEDVAVFAKVLALTDAVSTQELVLEIRKHDDSLRNRIESILDAGRRVVDHVFDPVLLPGWAMAYREEFEARQCLSLFRSCYVAGRKRDARAFYLKALSLKPLVALEATYLRKFLRVVFSWS